MMKVFFYIWLAILLFLICYVIYNLIKLFILSIQIHKDEKELRKLKQEQAEMEKEYEKAKAELEKMVGEDK